MGAVVHGLGGHYYYGAMERALPGTAPLQVAGKTAVDFLAFLPAIGVGFRAIHDAVKGTAPGEIVKGCVDSWKVPAPIWVMWSGLMFSVAPVAERVLFYNGVITLSALGKKVADKVKKDD